MADLAGEISVLSKPSSYGGMTRNVEARETHMSWVFLTDTRVYKLKKPVRYPFLDFSTREKRRFFCEEELRLNRRLASETYLKVVPLCLDGTGRLVLSGRGEPVDWLVEMVRLPESEMLDARLENRRVSEADILRIGRLLAGFYAACPPEIADGHLYLGHLTREQSINRSILEQRELGVSEPAGPALDVVDRDLELARPEIEARIGRGWILEGHGDLRPEHVCLVERPQTIDCLEFDRSMRIIDPFDEVNYLGMECDILGAPWVRPLLLKTLRERLPQRPSTSLLALYGAFRALLRARLCVAHLLETPVRHGERWRPLALAYIELAGKLSLSLPDRADETSIRASGGV